jgi:hypothetical protein
MCHWSPTKLSCLSCGNEWSEKVTEAFQVKLILCDNPKGCDHKNLPTNELSVAQYAAHMCDLCYLQLLTTTAVDLGISIMVPEDIISHVDQYCKNRRWKTLLWAVNMSGTERVYFGFDGPLTEEQKAMVKELEHGFGVQTGEPPADT